MKKAYHLSILLISIFLISNFSDLKAQNVTINTLTFPSPPAKNCTNTYIDVATQINCINAIHTGNTVNISGSTITVNIDYTIGIICLGALSYPTHNINLGMIPTGTYTVVVNGTWNGPIVSTKSTSLVVTGCCPAEPSFTNLEDTICVGDSLHFTNTTTGSISHEWFENNVSVGTQLNYGKRYNVAGTYRVKLEATDGNCTDSIAKNIVVKDYPTINLGNDTSICPGEPITLDAGAGRDAILWSTTSTNQTINIGTAGTYFVSVDEFGCISKDTIVVSLFPQAPSVNFGPDTTLCFDDSLILDATTAGVTYLWHDNSTNPVFVAKNPGVYTVILEDANTCNSTESINVAYYLEPQVSIQVSPGTEICNGSPFTFTAFPVTQGSIDYQWKVNNVNSGAQTTSPTFTGPVNYGDSVHVELITDVCSTTPYPVTSNKIQMILNPAPRNITGKLNVNENATETYVVPIVAGSAYLWRVTGGAIVGDSTKNIVTVKWGKANPNASITLVETDVKNCTRENDLAINVMGTIGIDNNGNTFGFGNAYPNPSGNLVTIPIYPTSSVDVEIELFDISGKLVKSIFSGSINSTKNLTFSVSDIQNGLYFYRITTANGFQSTKKLAVKH